MGLHMLYPEDARMSGRVDLDTVAVFDIDTTRTTVAEVLADRDVLEFFVAHTSDLDGAINITVTERDDYSRAYLVTANYGPHRFGCDFGDDAECEAALRSGTAEEREWAQECHDKNLLPHPLVTIVEFDRFGYWNGQFPKVYRA